MITNYFILLQSIDKKDNTTSLQTTIHTNQQMASTRLAPPVRYLPPLTMNRVTDYPVRTSPIGHQRTSSFQSNETDSLSTVSETISESSLTSDSSYPYDAHKKPKKKILKTSSTPRKRNKHRVRWNLNNLESVSDSTDSQSVDSLGSYGSSPHNYLPPHLTNLHNKTRETTAKTLANWRDYERPLPPGSTGLTPSRVKGLSHSYQLLNNPSIPEHNIDGSLYRTYSIEVHQPPRQLAPPTPDRYQSYYHDNLQKLSMPAGALPTSNVPTHSLGRVINVPVLHLEENDLPELDQSNIEERKTRRMYQFPVGNSFRNTPPLIKKVGGILEEDDDANDYDHLEPRRPQPPPALQRQMALSTKSDDQWYSNDDIDEALEMIKMEEESNKGSGSSDDVEEETPPPVPVKKRQSPPTPPKRVSSLNSLPKPIDSAFDETISNQSLPQQSSIILSPPPEFKNSTLPTERTPPTECNPSTDKITNGLPHINNPLHSSSMDTLQSYGSVSISQSTDDHLTPEIHPETNHTQKPLDSWGSPLKMKERIVEGAEDPHRNPSPIHNQQDIRKPSNVLSNGLGYLTIDSSNSDVDPRGSPLNRVSTIYITRHNSLSPKKTRDYKINGLLDNKFQSNSTHNLSHSQRFTDEEHAVMEWYNKSNKMKPIIVDTEKEIDQMIAEIGSAKKHRRGSHSSVSSTASSSSNTSKHFGKLHVSHDTQHVSHEYHVIYRMTQHEYHMIYYMYHMTHSMYHMTFCIGICCACQKTIDSSHSLFSFASRLYHNKCFCCAQCGK